MSSTKSHNTQPRSRKDRSERRVEVTVEFDSAGEREVILKDMSFGSGVGWYTEKSIRLDSQQVEALLRSLCACRHPSKKDASNRAPRPNGGATGEGGEATILTFPTVLPSS